MNKRWNHIKRRVVVKKSSQKGIKWLWQKTGRKTYIEKKKNTHSMHGWSCATIYKVQLMISQDITVR